MELDLLGGVGQVGLEQGVGQQPGDALENELKVLGGREGGRGLWRLAPPGVGFLSSTPSPPGFLTLLQPIQPPELEGPRFRHYQ